MQILYLNIGLKLKEIYKGCYHIQVICGATFCLTIVPTGNGKTMYSDDNFKNAFNNKLRYSMKWE